MAASRVKLLHQKSFDCNDVLILNCSNDSSCEVINLSVSTTSVTSQKSLKNISPQVKSKKEKHKAARKIILDEEEPFWLFHDEIRPNFKCVISGKCKREGRAGKCVDQLEKHNVPSKTKKHSKIQNNECQKTSLYVPERFKRDRIQPCCFRCKCKPEVLTSEIRGCWTTSVSREIKKKQSKAKENGNSTHKSSKNHRQNKNLCSKKHKKSSKDKVCTRALSPISMSPFPDDMFSTGDISYDDISMNSFPINSEEELDTLIKRTKERERSMVSNKLCRSFSLPMNIQDQPYRTSTPCVQRYDEDGASSYTEDMDVSVHSLPTVVLTPRIDTGVYSPTMSPTDLISNSSTRQDPARLSDCETNFKIKVQLKREPYSPSMSPRHIVFPDCEQNEIKKVTLQDLQVQKGISTQPSIPIKEEVCEEIPDMERELASMSPFHANYSRCMTNTITDMKKKKDSNFNDITPKSVRYNPCNVKLQVENALKIEPVFV